jgi:hypothetical protein
VQFSGKSCVTTAPAPTILEFPILIPGSTVAFEPISTKVFSAIPNVLSRWNEQPSLHKITFEWKKKIYQLLRKNETKVSQSQTYHKVYVLEKEYKDITSPSGICIKAEEWKEISSFYIKIYDENLPYNGEFYL